MRLLLAFVICVQALPASADVTTKMKVPWRKASTHASAHREMQLVRFGEDFVVRAGEVRVISVDLPPKQPWFASMIVMWDPKDGALDVSAVNRHGRPVTPVTFADDPGRLAFAANAVRVTATQTIPFRVRFEGDRIVHEYCCPHCVRPRILNCEPVSEPW